MRFLSLIFLFISFSSNALYVCEDNGTKNIVAQKTGPNCEVYVPGMFKAQKENSASTVKNKQIEVKKEEEALPLDWQKAATESAIRNLFSETKKEEQPLQEKLLTWECPQDNAPSFLVESMDQPLDNCQITNKRISAYRGKKARADLISKPLEKNKNEDIYKCDDGGSQISFVPESEKNSYQNCTFWSRSFGAIKNDLYDIKNSKSDPNLGCSGAGSASFDGKVYQYSCASHSYDYSAGTTGGIINYDGQEIKIDAHNLDYFGDSGNCGGTVTSENGKVFHLEATKDCPPAIVKAVAKIAESVGKSLNIKVNGAFKERQKALALQINAIAKEIGVDPRFVHAIISAESAYKPRAKSHAGAMGLMQLMPATARRFGVNDPYNTEQNIRGGTTYLKWLLKEFNGNMRLAAAGYNAGEGNVRKYGYKIPPFVETRAYVPKVMEYYRYYVNNPHEISL